MRDHRNAEPPEKAGIANPRALEDPRRVDRSGAADDFALGADGFDAGRASDLEPRRPPFLDDDPGYESPLPHREVRARQRRTEVEERGAAAPAAPRGAIHRGEAFLAVAVEVVGPLETGRDAGFDERFEQRIGRCGPGDGQRPFAAVVVIGAGVSRLGPPEVGEAVRKRPALETGDSGPIVVVERIPPDVDHAVDRGRATDHLPSRTVHAPPVHPGFRIRHVRPVVGRAALRIGERGRHPYAPLPPRHQAPCLDEQDTHLRIFAEAAREHAPRGSGPDENVVVAVPGHGSDPPVRLAPLREETRPRHLPARGRGRVPGANRGP